MDTFNQVAAYAAKLGLLVPSWMLLIMVDKHLLGLPVFQGSYWRSPRIPPRLTIKGRHGGNKGSKTSAGDNGGSGSVSDEATPLNTSHLERGFAASTKPYTKPFHASQSLPESLPTRASGSTALTVYQPLEVHDPFSSSSQWLEPGYVERAGLFVFVLVLLYIMAKKGWRPSDKSKETQSHKTDDSEPLSLSSTLQQEPAKKTQYQIGFECGFECALRGVGLPYSGAMTWPLTATPPPPILSLSPITSVQIPPSVLATPPSHAAQLPRQSLSAIVSVDSAPSTLALKAPVMDHSMITSVHSTPSAPASITPTTLHDNAAESVQGDGEESDESTEAIKAVVAALKEGGDGDIYRNRHAAKDGNQKAETKADTTASEENGQKGEDRNDGRKKKGSEAGEGDGKEGGEEESKSEIDGEVARHPSDVFANGILGGVSAEGEGKKKNKKMRQNKKKRLARRAAEEEASKEERVDKVDDASQEERTSDGGKKIRGEAGEGDSKEDLEGKSKGEIDEDLVSHSGDVLATDSLEGVPAVGEGKKKNKKLRQNAKRRLARAAEEEASKGKGVNKVEDARQEEGASKEGYAKKEAGKAPYTSLADPEVCEGYQAIQRPKAREDSQHEIVKKKKRETIINAQEGKTALANNMDTPAKELPMVDPQSEDLVAIRAEDQTQKKRRRRKQRTFLDDIILDSWEGEEVQGKQLPIVDGQQEASLVLESEAGDPVVRFPVESALGRAHINGRTNSDAPIQIQHDHATSRNPSQHDEVQSGGHYHRMKKLLDDSILRSGHANHGAISDVPFGAHESLIDACHQSSFRGRAPFRDQFRKDVPSGLPWGASGLPYARQPYIYADQGRANPAQRPIYFGPGVKPQTFVGRSGSAPWATNDPIPWRHAVSPSQGSWNEPTTKTWDTSASARLVQRGRLPYPIPPLEQRNDGLQPNADFAPFPASFFVGPHSSSRCVTATSDGLAIPFQGPGPYVNDTSAGEIDGLSNISALNLTDRSQEYYKYFPERGIRSRSSPPKSRSQSPSPVRNGRPRSSPPRHLSDPEAEILTQVRPNVD